MSTRIADFVNNKPFRMIDLMEDINEKTPWVPNQVQSLNLFASEPLFTDIVGIENRSGVITLIETTERGAPDPQWREPGGDVVYVKTPRISVGDTIMASELMNAATRAGSAQPQRLQIVRDKRTGNMKKSVKFTEEHMMLNALKGLVVDKNGTRVILDIFAKFDVTQEAEVAFDLANATAGTLLLKSQAVRRTMQNNLGADAAMLDHIHALVGSEFMDALLTNVDVKTWAAASGSNADIMRTARTFGRFEWAGIVYEEYRLGTGVGNLAPATGATAATGYFGGSWLAADKAIMFPVGPDIYKIFYSPGETFAQIDAPGSPLYAMSAPDPTWDEWLGLKVRSYPLPVVTRPAVLMKGKKGA